MAKRTVGYLVTVLIIGLIGLVAALEMQRQGVSAQLLKLSEQLNTLNTEQVENQRQNNEELAKKIIEEVKLLMDISTETEPTVATIIDVELLRSENPFYNKAENGDYLIVTPERAILYSSVKKKILDVAPITLEPVEDAGSGE